MRTLEEVVETEMRGSGLSDKPAEFDSSIHSWRCEYPDRYGPCDCFEEFRKDLADAVRAWLLGQRDVVAGAISDQEQRSSSSDPDEYADAALAALTGGAK